MLVKLTLALLLVFSSLTSFAHSQVITPQQVDFLLAGTIKVNGQPNSLGKIYFWETSAKTTAKVVWSDFAATTPLSNPVVLDSRGASSVFAFGTYYCELYDKNDVLIKTYTSLSYSYIPETESLFLDVGALYGRSQADIDEMLTDVSGTAKTLLFNSGTFNFTADTIFPATVGMFISDTASFNVSSGKTVTINGSLSYVPNRQVFFGTGSYDINTDANNIVSSVWLGGTGVGVGTQTPAYSLDVVGTVNATVAVNSVVGVFSDTVTIGNAVGIQKLNVAGRVQADWDFWAGDIVGSGGVVLSGYNNQLSSTSPTGDFTIWDVNNSLELKAHSNTLRLEEFSVNSSTVVTLPEGTSGAPALSSSANRNTGIFFVDDELGISASGFQKIHVNGNGVGVGTTNPSYPLHVVGIAKADIFLGSGVSITSLNASNLLTGTVPSARVAGAYSGITGLGTLTALTVDNIGADLNTISTTSGALNLTPLSGQNLNVTLGTTGDFAVNTSQLFVDTSAGLVGIGTTSASTIHASNALGNLVVGSGSGVTGLTVYSGAANYGGISFSDAASGSGTYAGYIKFDHTNDSFGHYIGNVERLRITSAGNVGIGTATPTNKFTVNGSQVILSTGEVFDFSAGADYEANLFLIESSNAINAGGKIVFGSQYAGTNTIAGASIGSEKAVIAGSGSDQFQHSLVFSTSEYSAGVTEKMRITSAGNVGIGTSSPLYKLDISGPTVSNVNNVVSALYSAANTGGGLTSARLLFDLNDSSASRVSYSAIDSYISANTLGAQSGALAISVVNEGTLTERLRITSAGNVGIGTATPGAVLDLYAGDGGRGITWSTSETEQYSNIFSSRNGVRTTLAHGMRGSSSVNNGFESSVSASAARSAIAVSGGFISMYVDSASTVAFGSPITPTERLRITSSGQVLVGSTSAFTYEVAGAGSVNNAITQQIEGIIPGASIIGHSTTAAYGPTLYFARSVGGTVGSVTAVVNNTVLGGIRFAGADGTDLRSAGAEIFAAVDGTPGSNDMPGRLVFSTTSDGASSPTERLRITSAGNVGIGTTSPSSKLDVNLGTGDWAHFRGTAGSGIQFEDTSNPGGATTQQQARIVNQTNNLIVTDSSYKPIAHFTARYGANDSRVGVNLLLADSPSYNLHVSGNAYVSTSLQIGGTGTVRIAGAVAGTGTNLIIDGSGDIRPETSSRRFKRDITNSRFDYNDVLKFELKEFTYKESNTFVPIGIMAEDTAEINPRFVNFDNDGLPYSINQSAVLYSLVGVVKELKDDSDFMINTLDVLIKKVAKLEAEVKYLRKVDDINANR